MDSRVFLYSLRRLLNDSAGRDSPISRPILRTASPKAPPPISLSMTFLTFLTEVVAPLVTSLSTSLTMPWMSLRTCSRVFWNADANVSATESSIWPKTFLSLSALLMSLRRARAISFWMLSKLGTICTNAVPARYIRAIANLFLSPAGPACASRPPCAPWPLFVRGHDAACRPSAFRSKSP